MNARERSLLRTVVSKRSPENIKLVDNLLSGSLDDKGRRILIDIVGDELLTEGFAGPDYSLNAIGDELESLIDAINRKVWGD
ncbi:hypothetical protein KMZ15_02370 [Mycoavidus sp. HKI]|uniref:hypothetical protein n=1 Tax=Mycoavidus sp. HKI TaxID=2840467 RepID=UPI001CC18464|nr:hypothetical protein [Mycoavidus sp. HKI]UAW64546.1 hypothetical protein KMZ15_02370 [Mycoavidus sp. HKI]